MLKCHSNLFHLFPAKAGRKRKSCFKKKTGYIKDPVDGIENPIQNVKNAKACQSECVANDDCFYWTWGGKTSKTCSLQGANKKTRKNKALTSGPKFCEGKVN